MSSVYVCRNGRKSVFLFCTVILFQRLRLCVDYMRWYFSAVPDFEMKCLFILLTAVSVNNLFCRNTVYFASLRMRLASLIIVFLAQG